MPQGVKVNSELDLTDRTYDGVEEMSHLSNGLGQLVDGKKGNDNFNLDVSGFGRDLGNLSGEVRRDLTKSRKSEEISGSHIFSRGSKDFERDPKIREKERKKGNLSEEGLLFHKSVSGYSKLVYLQPLKIKILQMTHSCLSKFPRT
ncbi:unnamed protein product [Acanthoscelides obtectus]|uniref:Discoidin domain-containing protein n=1 Tax=Acanthoscelides obtectus TaxID=200917 RepID=A0A9P0PH16_ACAOB|nr:unnamed protein product [Acanthoscelides obtectus]CAK1674767.1 hypothetical protein AOBTE_LOCUS29735 [Acanthoscelides obtectus]